MAVDKAQSMRNARTASAVIARGLGFYDNSGAGFRPGSLSPADQVRLSDELNSYVLANPHLFDADALRAAQANKARPLSSVALVTNPDWTLDDFTDAMLASAAVTLPAVGNKLLIAATVVACVGVAVYFWGRRAPVSAS